MRMTPIIALALAAGLACGDGLVLRSEFRDISPGADRIAHNSQSVTIARSERPPVIDGDLSDACWAAAEPLTDFTRQKDGEHALVDTEVRLCFDEAHLYVAFRCDEPAVDELKANHMEHDSDIWRDDDVEVFLCPNDDHHTYYQLMINSRGALADGRFDGGIRQGTREWESDAEIGSAVGDDFYAVEVAIPFEALGLPGAMEGARWAGNFCRTRYAGGEEITCWSYPGFHQMEGFAGIVFGDAPVTARPISLGAMTWGESRVLVQVANESGGEVPLRAEVLIDAEDALVAQPAPAPPGETQVAIPYRVERTGVEQRLEVRLHAAGPAGEAPILWIDRRFTPPPVLSVELSERSIFEYQSRTIATMTVTLPQADLARVSANVSLLDAGGETLRSTALDTLEGGGAHLLLDASGLAPGRYEVHVTLRDVGGEAIDRATEGLVVMASPF